MLTLSELWQCMHAGNDCPDDIAMCDDPGFLTCVGDTLGDCSGRGDCFRGRCFCHLGWGGADCSKPLCIDMLGCEDVRPASLATLPFQISTSHALKRNLSR
eukprot:jgi/Ulvmu1/4005/UM186_0005.1